MSVKIEKIELAETQISTMTSEESNMRTLYMRDGVIDDTEQAALDRIKGKIDKLKEVVAKLRAEIEENKRIWESRSGDYDNVRSQLTDLKIFGHGEAGTLDGEISTIADLVTDQRWADATTALDQAEVSMGPVWEDYQLQTAAQAEYDPMRADFDARYAAALVAEPQTEAIAAPLTQIDTNIGAIDAYVEARDYVNALDSLHIAISLLETAEQEILRVQEAKAIYESALAGLMPLLMQTTVSEFQKLADLQLELVTAQTAMEEAATLHDYETAKTRLDDLATKVTAFLPEQEQLRTLKAEYDGGLAAMRSRIASASTSELAKTAETQQKIIDVQAEMEKAATTEEFEQAIALQGDLDEALKAYEVIMEDRDLYETRLAAMQDEIAEASVSQAKWEYLSTIQSDMATIQGDMEAAATSENFESALGLISTLEGKLVEFYAAIEAKRLEYDTARVDFDGRFEHLDTCSYPLSAEKTAVRNAVAAIDALVAEEDWAGALDGLAAAEAVLDAFDTAHKAHDDTIRADVATKLVGIKVIITANALSASSTKKSLTKIVAEIDAALAKTDDLNKLQEKVKLADELSKDLEVINQINARIDDKWDINKDNEALAIVEDLKKDPAKLANLPFEARNRLIDEMLKGSIGADEQTAIKDLWASTKDSVDPAFEAHDEKLTGQMLKTLEDDPKVQEYAKNWAGMSNTDKQKAMKHIGGIIGGDDGYELDGIEDIDFTADGKRGTTDCKTRPGLRGWHGEAHGDQPEEISVCMCNTYTLSNGSKWDPNSDMGDVLMNLTHEVGHGYQEQLIDKLENDELSPGDPEYEQARALQLDRKYFKEFPDDYKGSAYINSPMEQLSRITANRMGSDLPTELGTGYIQEL